MHKSEFSKLLVIEKKFDLNRFKEKISFNLQTQKFSKFTNFLGLGKKFGCKNLN
jgi:hypothetical protein